MPDVHQEPPKTGYNLGIGVLAFSLEGEVNAALRNSIRRLIERHDMSDAGTTLFEGIITLNKLNNLVEEIVERVNLDSTGAKLTNLAFWFMGTQRYNYTPSAAA